jgi:WD40 repeat protein
LIGKVRGGLHYTPCGKYIVFPLGSFVVLKNLKTEREAFLDGHSNEINCIAISKDGTKLASGQRNITGVKVMDANASIRLLLCKLL